MRALREAEERAAQEEIERAQKLQAQLQEAAELEEAYRIQRIKEWRKAASKPDKTVFMFGDVHINEIIFVGYDPDEKEDLSPFPERVAATLLGEAAEMDFTPMSSDGGCKMEV